MKRALAAAALVLVLAGCAPTQGTIADKRHTAGLWYTTTQCTNKVCIPVQHYQPPTWAFDLYDGDDHGWRHVSRDTYDRFAVGDYYSEEKDQ